MSRKRAITTFLSQKSMITRLSIASEDFLGSSIAPQVMPPCSLIVSVQPVITQSVRPRAGSLSEEEEEVEEKKRDNPRQDQYHLQPHG